MTREVSQIGVRLPVGLREQVERFAEASGVSISELVRRAVDAYVEEGDDAFRRVTRARVAAQRRLRDEPSPEIRLYGEWMARLPREVKQLLRDFVDAVTRAEGEGAQRARSFTDSQTAIGVWRVDFGEPIAVAKAEDAQIEQGFRTGRISDADDVGARHHGYCGASAFCGTAAAHVLSIGDPHNHEALRAFIRGGYRVVGIPLVVLDPDGSPMTLICSMLGIVSDGQLHGVWGISRSASLERTDTIAPTSLRPGSEGTWCLEFPEPIDTGADVEAQVDAFFVTARWQRCSPSHAATLGVDDPATLERHRVVDFLPAGDAINRNSISSFVRSGYRLIGVRLNMTTASGERRVTHGSMVGHVEEGRLIRVWGTLQDLATHIERL